MSTRRGYFTATSSPQISPSARKFISNYQISRETSVGRWRARKSSEPCRFYCLRDDLFEADITTDLEFVARVAPFRNLNMRKYFALLIQILDIKI
jgi:hypothetical protein